MGDGHPQINTYHTKHDISYQMEWFGFTHRSIQIALRPNCLVMCVHSGRVWGLDGPRSPFPPFPQCFSHSRVGKGAAKPHLSGNPRSICSTCCDYSDEWVNGIMSVGHTNGYNLFWDQHTACPNRTTNIQMCFLSQQLIVCTLTVQDTP